MMKIRLLGPALAGLFCLLVSRSGATVITESFLTDPQPRGWCMFGNTNLFHWNSTNQNLEVTWDSSQPNSYFHHPLGTLVTRDDDFSIAFDLRLSDIASGTEPGKTGGFEIALGLHNLANATGTNFLRGAFGSTANLVEFDYFPAGYYDSGGSIFEVAATTTPTFISTNSSSFAPTVFAPYIFELPTNVVVRVALAYTASNQTLVTTITTNGAPLVLLPDVVLTNTTISAFTESDNFRVDIFSINSYSSSGNDFDSVLAHGAVDNIVVIVPPPPVQNLTGAFSNGVWQAQFLSRSNWLYTLERAVDLASWADVTSATPGNATTLILPDAHPPAGSAFYRVRANRP